jgi:hypothetical protein
LAPSYSHNLGFILGPIGAASVLIWVGVWGLQDHYFEHHSALASAGIAALLAMTMSSTICHACHAMMWNLLAPDGFLDALLGTLGSSILRDACSGCDFSSPAGNFDSHCIGSIYSADHGAADIPARDDSGECMLASASHQRDRVTTSQHDSCEAYNKQHVRRRGRECY